MGFGGIARRIERHYRQYRQRGEASSNMEEWLDKVMVEHTCPDCNGARIRATRLTFTIAGKTIFDFGQLHFDELHAFLGTVKPVGRGAAAGQQGHSSLAAAPGPALARFAPSQSSPSPESPARGSTARP